MTLTPDQLDDYYAKGMDDGDREILSKAIRVLESINPIALTKYLASINKSEKDNIRIATAAHKLTSSYYDSLNPNSVKNNLNSITGKYATVQEVSHALNLDHRKVGLIVKAFGIKKEDGFYSNDDIANIKDIYTNPEYGKSIPVRIANRLKAKNLGLQYISSEQLQILHNKKLKKVKDKTGVFDLD